MDVDYENGGLLYEVTLIKGSREYNLKYRASDGKLMEYEWETEGAQRMTGMPHTGGISDTVGNTAIEIADLKEELKELEKEIQQKEVAIRDYIKTIRNIKTRTAFRLRYIEGQQWKEVAFYMGKAYTPDRVKAMCYRELLEDA